jgi:site-specific recombinase XerD
MSNKPHITIPVFDKLTEVIEQYKNIYSSEKPNQLIAQWFTHCFAHSKIAAPEFAIKDYQTALNFLYNYRGSMDTFKAYRRDLERLIQWSWFIRNQSLLEHKREDIEAFIEFCLKPPKRWISLKKETRFKKVNGENIPNPDWRPFEAHVSKKDHKAGIERDKSKYQFSQSALKVMFGILSSFYNYLLQEQIIQANPLALIRQKSKFLQKETKTQMIRRLSNEQWETVIRMAKQKAIENPSHERTVFILSCLFAMYLRISELTATAKWTPTMGDFFKDSDGHWWFRINGKGNKLRQIAISDAMLEALKHYRTHYLGLSPLPSRDEKTPLIAHLKNPNKSIPNFPTQLRNNPSKYPSNTHFTHFFVAFYCYVCYRLFYVTIWSIIWRIRSGHCSLRLRGRS